jgi:hypothetical protein
MHSSPHPISLRSTRSHPPIYALVLRVLFSSGFPTKTLYFSLLSHACHMPRPPHFPSFDLPDKSYEASHCATFSILPLLRLLGTNIPISTLFSHSVYARPLMYTTKFHTHTKLAELTFTFLDSKWEDKTHDGMVTSIP